MPANTSQHVQLERITPRNVRKQAKAARAILRVAGVVEVLGKERPQLLEQFQERRSSVQTMRRFATTPELSAFIIHHNRVAKGVGLIATDQTISHPDRAPIEGTWLGYWIAPRLLDRVHEEIASQLIDLSPSGVQFATAAPGHKSGFRNLMNPVGEPALLTTDAAGEQLGIVNPLLEEQLLAHAKSA